MIGILKAMVGLSASVYTAIYVAFLDPNSVTFLLLLAVLPSVLAVLCVLFINRVPFIQAEPHTKVDLTAAPVMPPELATFQCPDGSYTLASPPPRVLSIVGCILFRLCLRVWCLLKWQMEPLL